MKYAVIVVCICLSGCSINVTRHTKMYLVCYKEDTLLTVTGQWESNQLYYKCDKRRAVGFWSKFGIEHKHDIITDFHKKAD